MPRLTQEEAVAIARRFAHRKKRPPMPILSVFFRPAHADPAAGSARDRWFVMFDTRTAEDTFVIDPCTVTVMVNDETGKARYSRYY